jgi:1-acyl-sn-glycerol-3-phosphate acyltransferase
MNGNEYVLAPPEYSNRRNLVFLIAKSIAVLAHRRLAQPHLEMDEEILRLRRQDGTVFFYVSLHKSLWETSGALVPIYEAGLPVPYVGTGDNLIHGRFFQGLTKRVGTFLIMRPGNRKEMLESARKLRDDILGFLAQGLDVMVFPEGTRKNVPTRGAYGEFFPATFEPVLEYERNKERICAANPGLRRLDAYIVPFNVDYSRVREAHEMVDRHAGTPQTLHVFDSLSMIRNIGDTYLSYGKPMRVAERVGLHRKELAAECRQRCLDLVKILPINVTCVALLRLDPAAAFSVALLEAGVCRVVEDLRPYQDRFRGFTLEDPPAEIIRRARQHSLDVGRFVPEDMPFYRLYAGYVRHYLEAPRQPLA